MTRLAVDRITASTMNATDLARNATLLLAICLAVRSLSGQTLSQVELRPGARDGPATQQLEAQRKEDRRRRFQSQELITAKPGTWIFKPGDPPRIVILLRERQVLVGAMLCTAAVLGVYPLVHAVWLMAVCAVLLGLALGSVQPMIMSTLHHTTPHERHGEAIALRSMTINFASTVMPLLFGIGGAAFGAGALFWGMAAAVGAGSLQARRF